MRHTPVMRGASNICLTDKYDNLIVVKSFSKDYALAGLRLGCIVSNPLNIDNIKRVLHPYNVNSIAVAAANATINDKKYIKLVKDEITKSKKYLYDEIKNLDLLRMILMQTLFLRISAIYAN